MHHFGRWHFLPVLVWFFLLIPARLSAGDFPPVNSAELKITSLPNQPGAAAYVLYREEIDDDQMHFHQVYQRIKILTDAGRKYADVELAPYNSREFSITDIKGRTIHADGTIIPFEGKPFEKTVIKGEGVSYKVKAFTLPDVQAGSIIEYRYTLRYNDTTVLAPHWTISSELYQQKVHLSFKRSRRDVIIDHDQITDGGVSWTWSTFHNEKPVEKGDRIEIDVEKVPAFEQEEYMPPASILKAFVDFYYTTDFTKTSELYWKEEGGFWNKDIEKFAGGHGLVDAQLSQIISPGDTNEQKVRKIYAWVGTLENTTYKPERTEKEIKALGLKENRTADDVLRQKSGDRDDITRLFITMVRRAGIPAYAMRVTGRDDSYFLKTLLDYRQLDYEVAIVQIDGKEVFLDPGTRFCPYGKLYWVVTACVGLRQSAASKGAEFAQTPAPEYSDSRRQRSAVFSIASTGPAVGTIEATFTGQYALRLRLRGARTDDDGKLKLLQDEARKWLTADAEVRLLNKPEWENAEKPLLAVFKVSAGLLTSAGHRVLLPLNLFAFNQPSRFSHKERRNAVYFQFPFVEVDMITFKLPPGFALESLPQSDVQTTGYAAFLTKYTQAGDSVTAERQVGVGTNIVTVEKYPELKALFDKSHDADQQQAVLKGGRGASQGQ